MFICLVEQKREIVYQEPCTAVLALWLLEVSHSVKFGHSKTHFTHMFFALCSVCMAELQFRLFTLESEWTPWFALLQSAALVKLAHIMCFWFSSTSKAIVSVWDVLLVIK